MPKTIPARKKSFRIEIKPEWCKGCSICALVCPKKVFEMDKEPSQTGYFIARVVRPENCIGCLECELHCPDLAIAVSK